MSRNSEIPIAGGLNVALPKMATVHQHFDGTHISDVEQVVLTEMARPEISARVTPGMTVAIGAGSRAKLRAAVVTAGVWALAVAALYTLIYAGAGAIIVQALTGIDNVRAGASEYLVWLMISPIISVWSFLLDGIFIGATRTAEMRNGMLISLAVFLAALYFLQPNYGNHGLWLSLMLFMVVRAITLGAYYPRLERGAGLKD